MKTPPNIPIPASVRWRDFRARILPLLVFVAAVGVITMMWRERTGQVSVQGVGEGVRASVSAPQTVQIKEWLVPPHSIVAAGTPVAVVIPADARADFDLLRSLHELARIESQPSLAEDNAMNFERIRVELLKTKSELAIARVKLEQAERDVVRNTPLFRDKLLSADLYELSVNVRDALKVEVEEKEQAVAQIEKRLENLRPIGEPEVARKPQAANDWYARLEKAHEAAARNLEPQTLVAPIAGMVGVPIRQAGEFVAAGEPLIYINSLRAENVVGYLRQPYRFDPQVGMPARVITRTSQRQVFDSQVIQVGAHLETLTNMLALLRPGMISDAALPIIVSVPLGVNIRPGEVVDIQITPEPAMTTSAATQADSNHPSL